MNLEETHNGSNKPALDKYVDNAIKNIFTIEEKSKYKYYGQVLAKLMKNIDFECDENIKDISIDPIDNNILNLNLLLFKFINNKEDNDSIFKKFFDFIWNTHNMKFYESGDLLKSYVYRLSTKIFKESFYENFGRTINGMHIKDFSCEYRIKQDKYDYNKLLISFKLVLTDEDKEKYNIEKNLII